MKNFHVGRAALSLSAAAAMLAGCGSLGGSQYDAGAPTVAQAVPARSAAAGRAAPELRIGTWTGKLTQPVFGTYSFQIQVQASSGGQISGTSYIALGSEWAIMSFTGSTSKGTISYTETGIVEQHGGNWCIKSATLHLRQDRAVLKGPWTADGCTGGEIKLRRGSES
jgi:hypothetical protein